jgi:hypothetical protein
VRQGGVHDSDVRVHTTSHVSHVHTTFTNTTSHLQRIGARSASVSVLRPARTKPTQRNRQQGKGNNNNNNTHLCTSSDVQQRVIARAHRRWHQRRPQHGCNGVSRRLCDSVAGRRGREYAR